MQEGFKTLGEKRSHDSGKVCRELPAFLAVSYAVCMQVPSTPTAGQGKKRRKIANPDILREIRLEALQKIREREQGGAGSQVAS